MEPEPAQEVKNLLKYEEHTAGGRMTPDVFVLTATMTAQQAIDALRARGPDPETTYYLFVTDTDNHLVGVVSLRSLVTAQPDTPITSLMNPDVIKVHVNDDQEDVAEVIRKYHLLGVPVVDDDNHLLGMITVDDILDVLREESTEDISQVAGTAPSDVGSAISPLRAALSRVAWLSATLAGGLVAAWILHGFSVHLQSAVALVYFLPLLVALGSGVGTQALAVSGQALPSGEDTRHIWREVRVALVVGVAVGVLVAALAFLWMGRPDVGLVVGGSLFLTLLIAAALGTLLPLVAARGGILQVLAAAPIIDALVSIASVMIYVTMARYLLP